MKPEQVPPEWVLAAWNGWAAGNQDGMHAEAMAHALAAVAPLIAARERERCARVADAKEDEYETAYRAGLKSSQHLQGMSDGAGEVAAAIRALDAPRVRRGHGRAGW